MCNCHSILECCVMFSGVKLSIRSFNLFIIIIIFSFQEMSIVRIHSGYFYEFNKSASMY